MKAIVCGAGIAGLASAYFLSRAGWEVLVVERAGGLRAAGYMIDFFGSGYDAVEAGGLLPALAQRDHKVDRVINVSETGRTRSMIDYRQLRASLDGRLLALLRGDLERVLFEALPESVDLRYGTSIAEIHSVHGGADVTLTSGDRLSADLLIGADGIHSQVRRLLFGPEEEFLRYLGFHTAAFVFKSDELVRALNGEFVLLSVPKRQVGLYSAAPGEVTAFFAHSARAGVRPDDPAGELARTYGDLGWHVPAILEALRHAGDIYYDVVAQIEMPRWRQGRAVLVGDAGYAVSLLAGQGASLAVGGPFLLARMLEDLDLDEAIDQFEMRLRPAIVEKQVAGRKVVNWFVPPSVFHNWLRDAFLNVARLPLLSGMLAGFIASSVKSVVR